MPAYLRLTLIVFLLATACSLPATTPTPDHHAEAAATLVPRSTQTPRVSPFCPDAIAWDQAKAHAGKRSTIRGPVVEAIYDRGASGQPTFLYLGRPNSTPGGVTVLIRDQYRWNFPSPPEQLYYGRTICVSGMVSMYQGNPQIEVRSPSNIVIVR